MHGGTVHVAAKKIGVRGLSPHARGNRGNGSEGQANRGPIPACTGEPKAGSGESGEVTAYPRMHGGTQGTLRTLFPEQGLSPHARGNL